MIKAYTEWLNEASEKPKLTPEQVKWCDTCIVQEWWVNANGEVEVEEDLNIQNLATFKTFTNFPVKFADIKGYFSCINCPSLTSLKGAPSRVGKNFYCGDCKSLPSLEGAPSYVGGKFYSEDCTGLTSLKGAPSHVGEDFYCNFCVSLTSLKGSPSHVGGAFYCNECHSLTSLEGAPSHIGKHITFKGSPIRQEEIDLLDNSPDLFYSWIKSGLSFSGFRIKYKGKITGSKFGL